MSTINRAENRRIAPGPPADPIAGHIDRAGVYLTDEVFLYRIAGFVDGDAGEMAEVEDCYGLDVVHVPVRELRARRLRVVTPARIEG